jgi:hypothetical protein
MEETSIGLFVQSVLAQAVFGRWPHSSAVVLFYCTQRPMDLGEAAAAHSHQAEEDFLIAANVLNDGRLQK